MSFPEWVEKKYNNFQKEIKEVMSENGETYDDVIHGGVTKEDCENSSLALDLPYFTLWTKNYVYFQTECRDYGYIVSAPRNPPTQR